MAIQFDVKSTHLNASGSVFGGPARVKGFSICATASQAGTLLLKDGGSSGTTLIEIDIPSNSNPNSFYVAIPHEGILFQNGIYLTLSVGSVSGITIFYG